MGVAPEAIAKIFLGIDSKYMYCLLIFCLRYSWYDYALDARQIYSIVLAPESMRGCVVNFHILHYCSATFLFIVVALRVSFLCPLYMLPLLYFLLGAKYKSP
jgi:hypothetical protein